jgi:two-component system invasion response regulator UvrY
MMNNAPIRILIADDHAIVREGYRSLLEKQPGMQVVAEAADGAQAYARFVDCAPDVVIMDLSMPEKGGLSAITRIRQRDPQARVLAFSMHQNPEFAIKAIQAGALGYVTKSSHPDVLIRAIRDVHGGRRALSPDITQGLALARLSGDKELLAELTVREFEILKLLVEAHSTEEIAQSLNISPKTVANCHYQIKRKLGVATDIELVRLAVKMNLVDVPALTGIAAAGSSEAGPD